jgi:hypothetical protein
VIEPPLISAHAGVPHNPFRAEPHGFKFYPPPQDILYGSTLTRDSSCAPIYTSCPGGKHSPTQNHLLAALPAADYERLLPVLELVPLPLDCAVYEADGKLSYAAASIP